VIVNFGCGPNAPDGYVNVDGSPTVLLARLPLPAAIYGQRAEHVRAMRAGRVRYGTARRLRFPPGSVDGFYASHVLEHLSRDECGDLLRRVRTWLKPRGGLRVVLPDLRLSTTLYLERKIDADQLVEHTGLAIDGLSGWRILLGHAYHRWMYDAESAARLLDSLGYTKVKRCTCGESNLYEFAILDRKTDRASESFYLEASP